MTKALKILKYSAAITGLIIVILLLVSVIFQDKVTQLFISEFNKRLQTTITVKKVRLSLLKNFPRASVQFRDIVIKSPDSFQSHLDDFIVEQNLLKAKSVSVSFRLGDLVRKKYDVDRIEINGGNLLLLVNNKGESNLGVWEKEKKAESSSFEVNLRNIKVSDTYFSYSGGKTRFILGVYIKSTEGKIGIDAQKTDISFKTVADIDLIKSNEIIVLSGLDKTKLSGNILLNNDSLCFSEVELIRNNQQINISGTLLPSVNKLDFIVTSKKLQVAELKPFLPKKVSRLLREKSSKGELDANLHLLGSYYPKNNLKISGSLNLKTIKLKPSKKMAELTLSSVNSIVDVSLINPLSSSTINVSSYEIEYCGTSYSGTLKLKNAKSSWLDLNIRGNTNVSELLKNHPLDRVESINGTIRTSARLKGNIPNIKHLKFSDLLNLKRYINLNLDDIELGLKDSDLSINKICGNIMISENAWIDQLSLILDGQNIIINSEIKDIANIRSNSAKAVEINAGIWADSFDSKTINKLIINDKEKKSKIKNTSNNKAKIITNLSITCDKLKIKKFEAAQFNTSLTYKDSLYNISNFSMLTLGGKVGGNVTIASTKSGKYIAQGLFKLNEIKINKAFSSFNNFGQKSLKAENINGLLTGSISLSAKTDSNLKPIMSTLQAQGLYSLRDGELINFEPAQKLSKFVEISELEVIKFKELKNTIEIRNEKLIIPYMDINSSAFNIALSGEQSFSGEFEYHLKVLLSEVLSKKAKKADSYKSEFGDIQNDGLGRTTLFLKLKGDKNGTTVRYDINKLSQNIKKELRDEKKTIKAILKEEYGWYKNDSTINKTEEKSRKFRITWEEAEIVESIEAEEKPKKKNIFQRLRKNTEKKNDTLSRKY